MSLGGDPEGMYLVGREGGSLGGNECGGEDMYV